MTRVLMTADTLGGVWTYTLELIEALAPHGVEVHLATMGRALTAEQRAALEQTSVASVEESELAVEWMPDPWEQVDRAGSWLLELESELQPDLVHLNGFVHADQGWTAPTLVVGHSDVLSWWQAVHNEPAPATWHTYRDRVSAGLAAAGAVVTPSRDALVGLRRWFGAERGTVIPNCRRDDWVEPVQKEPLVLAAGRVWDQAKNLELLAAAAVDVPWPVVVAGEGDPLGGAARFLGPLPFPELAGWLGRASVFAAPAKYEPFGLGILEAALAGCALVLGDIPSLREVWADAALYVDPTDRKALVTVLQHLATDEAMRTSYATRAQVRAAAYSPKRTGRAYADVYSKLVAGA